jgi:DNA helicase HerA-like ATPase
MQQGTVPITEPLDIIASADGDRVIVQLDIRNNARIRVGDQYAIPWDDGAIMILRVERFQSAEEYTNTSARRMEAMREGVVGPPQTMTARKAYQVKLAILRIEGELLPNGTRILGASRTPDVMVPLEPLSDTVLEQFVNAPDGNLILGQLRTGSRILNRAAQLNQNYAGERMLILGQPGSGKSQLIRSLLSQIMADDTTA